MEEIMEIDIPDFCWNEYNRHYRNTSVETLDRINVNEANNLKKQFISIGFFLRLTKESGAYKELGYDKIENYAYDRMGYSESRTRRLMQINAMASKDGCSPVLDEQYKAFKSSQLQEMLSMLEDQRQLVTPDMTVRQIKDMKKALAPIEIAGYQCTKVDEWTSDGDTYILGNCIDDNNFFYASVNGKEEFEFDHKPTREEVEGCYIDLLAMRDIDRHEAEIMGFGMDKPEPVQEEAEPKRPEPSDRDIKAFYDWMRFKATDNINANDLKIKYRHAGGGGGGFNFQGSPRGCRINYKQEITWVQLAKRLKDIQEKELETVDAEYEDCATSRKSEIVSDEPETSIDNLELSVSTYTALKRAGIDTIGQLKAANLVAIRGLGARGVNEIDAALEEIGAMSNNTETVPDQVIDGECIELPEEPVAAAVWPDLLSDMPVFSRVVVKDYLDKVEKELREHQEAEELDGTKFPESLMQKKKMAVAGARLLLRLVEGMEIENESDNEVSRQ